MPQLRRTSGSTSTRRRCLLVGAGALLAVSACGGTGQPTAAPVTPSSTSATTASGALGPVTVFAASSLTGAFTRIGKEFEAANPGSRVTFNFGASSALAQQIVSGAPVDVFAAASPAAMKVVNSAGDAGAAQVFVRNMLQIAVPPANPGRVRGLADFARTPLKIALCAPKVPCGTAATRVFAAAGITPRPDTLEQDVKAALTRVELGEVDAALVYRTDVLAAHGKVRGIAFPEAARAVNDYPLAALTAAPHADAARAFVAYVLAPEGQKVLAAAGFQAP